MTRTAKWPLRRGIELGDRAQEFATITKENAELFEVLIGQVREHGEIDAVLGEALRVFGHPETFEPVCNLLHALPSSDRPHDFLPKGIRSPLRRELTVEPQARSALIRLRVERDAETTMDGARLGANSPLLVPTCYSEEPQEAADYARPLAPTL